MPKRLTNTEKWKQVFFRGLPPAYKLLWIYICDDCDHCGIWTVDFEVAQIRVGLPLDEKTATDLFKSSAVFLPENYQWFIPEMLDYKLSLTNPVHRKILTALKVKGIRHENLNCFLDQIQAEPGPGSGPGLARNKKKKKNTNKNSIILNKKETAEIPPETPQPETQQPEIAVWPTFDDFWNLYDKKSDRWEVEPLWKKLKQEEKEAIMLHLPDYKRQEPDKKYRKNPSTYIRKKSWTNEIYNNYEQPGKPAGSAGRHEPFTEEVSRAIQDKFAAYSKQRAEQRGRNQPSPKQVHD